MKNKTISIFILLSIHSTLFAQNVDTNQSDDTDFIKSVKMNFKQLEKNILLSEDNISKDTSIKFNNEGLTSEILATIKDSENEAIAEAEAIKLKIIVEAEVNRANIIAKALKDRTIAESEAIKATSITKAKAIALVEHKLTKLKEEQTIVDAIAKNDTIRTKAELFFQKETQKIQDKMNKILGVEENTSSNDINSGIKAIPEKTAFKMIKTLSAKENISKLFNIEKISFKTGKHVLTQEALKTVHKLARILNEYPEVSIEIAGHTDSGGSRKFNKKLSQSRVNIIKEILITESIDTKRLVPKGYGESKPLVPNTSKKNKAKNRRIEINIL